MNSRISLFLLSLVTVFTAAPLNAQKLKKSDKAIIAHLSTHVTHLSYDKAPGQQPGEQAAIDYISSQFKLTGIEPKGDNGTYVHTFEIAEGIEISSNTHLFINGDEIARGTYFPLLMSPSVHLEAAPSLSLHESGEPWFMDLKEILTDSISENAGQLNSIIAARAKEVKGKGCTALFIYNTSDVEDGITFDGKQTPDSLALPVIYISRSVAQKHFSDETAMLDIKLNVSFTEKKHTGRYVIGFINNNAAKTIMIGTNESADNAATLIEIGSLLKNSRSKNNNFLLVAFFDKQPAKPGVVASGKYSASESPKENYMINVSGTPDTEKLNYIYTIVEKAK